MLSAHTKKSKFSSKSRAGHKKTKSNPMKPNGMNGGAMSEENRLMFEGKGKVASRVAQLKQQEQDMGFAPNTTTKWNQSTNQGKMERQGKGIGQFGRVFNNRTNEERKAQNNERNTDRFFREIGRPVTDYNKTNMEQWRANYIERADKYLDNKNHATGLSRYQLLKRAQRRMNNNLYKTRATLEKEHGYNWNRSNRNNKFDRMFTMTKKQLQKIRNHPRDYLDNPANYMSEPEGMANTPYIGQFD